MTGETQPGEKKDAVVVIELPWPTPSQNERDRWLRKTVWKLVLWKTSVNTAVNVSLAKAKFLRPAQDPSAKRRVTVTRYSAGTLDDANFRGGCKDVIDILRDRRLIRDDSPTWMEASYVQQKCKRGEGRTVIEVELT